MHPNPVLLLTFLCVKIKLDILYSLVCDFASIHCDIGILIYSLLVHLTRKFVSVEQAVLSHYKLLTRQIANQNTNIMTAVFKVKHKKPSSLTVVTCFVLNQ